MTRKQEIIESTCVYSNLIYANYESGAYGILPRMPYDSGTIEELRLKRDLTNHNIVMYMSEPNFVFTQISQESVWTIIHELGYNPKILVVDCQNKKLEPIVLYTASGTTITLIFNIPTSGRAFLT